MKSKQVRVGASLVASIVLFVLIDRAIPVLSTDLPTALARMSACAFVAFAIGGFIARTDFVLAAVILAMCAWLGVTGYSVYLGSEFESPVWESLVWSLPSSVLILAAAAGAKLGTLAASRQSPRKIA